MDYNTEMARTLWIVPLFALAATTGIAQSGALSAIARGGCQFIGGDGEAAGSISGEIKISRTERKADLMFVLKDVGGATSDGQNEAIVFLNSVTFSKLSGGTLLVVGKGTFQGEPRDVEMTLIDSKNPKVADQIKTRVMRFGRVEFEHSAKLNANSITIKTQ